MVGGESQEAGGLFSKSYYRFSFLFLHKFVCSYFYSRVQINWNMLNSEAPLLHFMNFFFSL